MKGRLFAFEALWQGDRWIEQALVETDDKGIIRSVASGTAPAAAETVPGWALPGVPNAHSHAFQFAIGGLTEALSPGAKGDDFWSWREAMYALALTVGPEAVEAIAAYLYAELLARGFTSVAEFHYLHLDPNGSPYAEPTALAEALCRAAAASGIRLTLGPVHYRLGDFGKSASPRQKRFLFKDAASYLTFAELCAKVAARYGQRIGGGVHSLRASPPDDTIEIFKKLPASWPRHLHIAEQQKEVEACRKALGKRPVEWALENLAVDARFHLVHATHMERAECEALARSGAQVVLCPTTEANLGDGLFDLVTYKKAGGRFSIGTDSHVGIDPWEELRLLEYGQRLTLQKRNPLCAPGEGTGDLLLKEVVGSGERAMGGSGAGFLRVGDPLDAAVVGAEEALAWGLRPEHRVGSRIFAGGLGPLFGTMVGGRWVARGGAHLEREKLAAAARQALGNRR
jgi:formimidoylglutamate deiminase